MSERWVYVACTCYRDGLLLSDPPISRSEVVFDRYGNVMEKTSRTPEDDSDEFWDWRSERACIHYNMRFVEEIWDARNWRSDDQVAEAIASGRFPHLEEVLDNSQWFTAATILATPQLAAKAIADFDELAQVIPRIGQLATTPMNWTTGLWPFLFVRKFLDASALTGNPLVGYHSVSSLGFEQ